MTTRRPLPRDVPVVLRLSEVHSESPVPSLWFCTTSTASSAWRFAGLLHPAADHEVRCVSCSHVPSTAAPDKRMMAGRSRCEIPAARLGPLEGCSPSTAVPRHRGRCLLAVGVPPGVDNPSIPLPGWRSCRSRTVASASRPCSVVGSVARSRRCRRDQARSFHGLRSPSRSI